MKKCCLANDEAVVRRATVAGQMAPIQRAESILPTDDYAPEQVAETAEAPWEEDVVDEPALPPEVENRLNELWDAYEALKQPASGQMDEFLGNLLALPPEVTSWSDLFHKFARQNHPDLPAVFHRISGEVSYTEDTGLAFFYWAAAEEFARRGFSQVLPEVAAGFRKLDLHSYDADALGHLDDYLLAARFDTETLQLAEHFLPIMRADDELMPNAASTCRARSLGKARLGASPPRGHDRKGFPIRGIGGWRIPAAARFAQPQQSATRAL